MNSAALYTTEPAQNCSLCGVRSPILHVRGTHAALLNQDRNRGVGCNVGSPLSPLGMGNFEQLGSSQGCYGVPTRRSSPLTPLTQRVEPSQSGIEVLRWKGDLGGSTPCLESRSRFGDLVAQDRGTRRANLTQIQQCPHARRRAERSILWLFEPDAQPVQFRTRKSDREF